ncbi:MAG: hypothetical protein KGQ59_11475 [Bdellovibrionales bacterium]|nr:hypothetical protein [Bdellovibrionales bacterium]
MKSNLNKMMKSGLIALAVMLLPAIGHAGTESVSCKTVVSFFQGQPGKDFSASSSENWLETDLNASRVKANSDFKRGLISAKTLMSILSDLSSVASQRSQTANKKAGQEASVKVKKAVQDHADYLSRVLKQKIVIPSHIISCSNGAVIY